LTAPVLVGHVPVVHAHVLVFALRQQFCPVWHQFVPQRGPVHEPAEQEVVQGWPLVAHCPFKPHTCG
jgi:hypothetical protein